MEMNEIIKSKLKEIEEKENIRILIAVESGSRAWGFPSPDSDYDVRFIYVRKKEDYLKLNPPRDVIEWQLDETLDINGWDLQKALLLLMQSNPVLFEWANSPIIYYEDPSFAKLREIMPKYYICKKGVHHYLHMAERNNRDYLQDESVKLKKYFYVLRPILAARWIVDKRSNPPMEFDKLVEAELDNSVKPVVQKLLEQKKITSELGMGNRIVTLNDYIDNQIKYLANIANTLPDKRNDWDELNDYFIKILDKQVDLRQFEKQTQQNDNDNFDKFKENVYNLFLKEGLEDGEIGFLMEEHRDEIYQVWKNGYHSPSLIVTMLIGIM